MKNRLHVWLISATIVWVIASPATATEQTWWKDPWKLHPKFNLYTLIREGYNIVDVVIGNHNLGGTTTSSTEVVYLREGRNIFRCATITDPKKGAVNHFCQQLVAPQPQQGR